MQVKLFLETYKNFQDILEKELRLKYEILEFEKVSNSFVIVLVDLKEAFKIAYSIQGAIEVGVLQHIGKLEDYNDNKQFVNSKIMISSHIKKERDKILGHLYEKLTGVTTDMKNPDYQIFFNELDEEKYIIGYKLINNFDFKKRSYKIYLSQQSISGPLATLILLLEDEILLKQNSKIGFFFPKDGVFAIECASLLSNKSVRFFDKQKLIQNCVPKINDSNITQEILQETFDLEDKKIKEPKKTYIVDVDPKDLNLTEKNAIIADLKNNMEFSRIDLDFWDYKFEEKFYDLVIAYPKFFNKFTKEKKMNKLLDSYFFQFEYILKDKKKLIMILKSNIEEKIKLYSKKYKFSYKSISFGRNDTNIYVFE